MSAPAELLPLTRHHVLLLEDSDEDADRIERCLRAPGRERFVPTRVRSVAELIQRLPEQDWSCLLVDLCVEDSQGLETFIAVQAAAGDLPIVVQSGIALEAVALQAVERGAQDYLVKRSLNADVVRRSLCYAMKRHAAEQELRRSKERYRLAIAGAHDGIWDWDLEDGTLFVSDRWCDMLGYGKSEVGTSIDDWISLLHPRDRDRFLGSLEAHLDGAIDHFEEEHRILHSDGRWLWVRTRGLAVRNPAGRPTRMAGSLSDVTARRSSEAELLRQALHDPLTDLPNRALLLDRLEHAAQRTRRRDSRGFAVLFLDLDRFKVVNDSMGHAAGDQLLVAVSQRLQDCVRPGDTVARLGGDEFAILVEELRGQGIAEVVAGRVHHCLESPIEVRGQDIYSSVSIGIARCTDAEETAESLLRKADIAMYRAKAAGRACSKVFDEAMAAWTLGRLTIESGLRRAVDRGEFVLHYQPIVRLRTGRVESFEALIRWESPERGLIGPNEFIPVAEESGLISEVGHWALRRACEQALDFDQNLRGIPSCSVAVNVSSHQLVRHNFVEEVFDVLQQTGLSGDRLVLELTETVLMESPARAAETLTELRARGIRIHLDDFGMGYSSLSYLRRFPIDRIKIDRAFVGGATTRPEDEAIVRAILGLAEALGIEVIAEGIETVEQWQLLCSLHCDFGQGFLFSRPVGVEKVGSLQGQDVFARSLVTAQA